MCARPRRRRSAEIVVRSRQEFQRHLQELEHKIFATNAYLLLAFRHHLKELATHIGFRRLEELLRRHRQQTDELSSRLGVALAGRIEQLRHRYTIAGDAHGVIRSTRKNQDAGFAARAAARRNWGMRMERLLAGKNQLLVRLRLQLDERSPLRVLDRGYAIALIWKGTSCGQRTRWASACRSQCDNLSARPGATVRKVRPTATFRTAR